MVLIIFPLAAGRWFWKSYKGTTHEFVADGTPSADEDEETPKKKEFPPNAPGALKVPNVGPMGYGAASLIDDAKAHANIPVGFLAAITRGLRGEELTEMIATSSRRLQMIEEQVEPQLKDLALRIARKILGRELEFHPEAVVDIVKQALSDKARQRREVYLRVNPDDLQYIREHKSELLEVLGRAKEIGLREDPGVEPHGVIIETDAGTIDAQLETQLAVFERVFKGLH